MSGGNSLVQVSVPDKLRGRVMSIYVTVMMGIAPLGSLLYGLGGARLGCQTITKFCACACFFTGCVYLISLRLDRKRQLPGADAH